MWPLDLKLGLRIAAGLALCSADRVGLPRHIPAWLQGLGDDVAGALGDGARPRRDPVKDAALAAQKAAQDATDARNASIVETLSNVAKATR